MLPGLDESQPLQPVRKLSAEAFIYRKLKKLDAVVLAGLGGLEQDIDVGHRLGFLGQTLAGFLFQVQQRAQTVGGVSPWRRGAKAVVEDLQRQRPGVATLDNRCEEFPPPPTVRRSCRPGQ